MVMGVGVGGQLPPQPMKANGQGGNEKELRPSDLSKFKLHLSERACLV